MILPGIVKIYLGKKYVSFEWEISPDRREAEVLKKYLTNRTFMKEIRIMNTSEFFQKKWETAVQSIHRQEKKLNKKIAILRIVADGTEQLSIIVSYFMCVYLALSGRISIADFGSVIVIIGQFLQKAAHLTDQMTDIHSEALEIHKAIKYFECEEEARQGKLDSIDEIIVSDVSYVYPEGKKPAVENISITLKQGEILAVVGENGSGKSTLSKLILGLMNPTDGEIRVKDVKMKDVTYDSLYKNFSAVFQDYGCYFMSIANNIMISDSRKSFSEGEVYDLLKKMGITFINDESNITLRTELGVEFGGMDLSGGQWQQLAIARSAYREAQVIVLDEPTSAIDAIKEEELYHTFKKLCSGKIGILITHRLGLCACADKILVLDDGKIAEYGTRDRLIKNNGLYSKLYFSQKQLYENK